MSRIVAPADVQLELLGKALQACHAELQESRRSSQDYQQQLSTMTTKYNTEASDHQRLRRRLVRVTIDGDGPDGHGPSLDEISEATAEISHCLDDSGAMGESPYTLEVSSRGVSTPLTQPRHYRRNIGHLVRFTLNPAEEQKSGETFDGRIAEAGEEVVTLEVEAEFVVRVFSERLPPFLLELSQGGYRSREVIPFSV